MKKLNTPVNGNTKIETIQCLKQERSLLINENIKLIFKSWYHFNLVCRVSELMVASKKGRASGKKVNIAIKSIKKDDDLKVRRINSLKSYYNAWTGKFTTEHDNDKGWYFSVQRLDGTPIEDPADTGVKSTKDNRRLFLQNIFLQNNTAKIDKSEFWLPVPISATSETDEIGTSDFRFDSTKINSYLLSKFESEKINAVFVPPANEKYIKASSILRRKKLLIISGPPHIGKTAMAVRLALALRKKGVKNIFKFSESTIQAFTPDIHRLPNPACFILDDAFGKTSKLENFLGDHLDLLAEMTRKHYLILTTRTNLLNDAKGKTRLGELSDSHFDDINIHLDVSKIYGECDYYQQELEAILDSHLKYYSEIKPNYSGELEIAKEFRRKIINQLQFPNSYNRLTEIHLTEVVSGKDFDQALKDASQIEQSTKRWFLRLTDLERYFVIAIITFYGQSEEFFQDFYSIYIDYIRNNIRQDIHQQSIPQMRNKLSVYITERDLIYFKHPSYYQAVSEAIDEYFPADREAIFNMVEYTLSDYPKPEVDEVFEYGEKARICYQILGSIGDANPSRTYNLLLHPKRPEYDQLSPFGVSIRRQWVYALSSIAHIYPDEVLKICEDLVVDESRLVAVQTLTAIEGAGTVKPGAALKLIQKHMKAYPGNAIEIGHSIRYLIGEFDESEDEEFIKLIFNWLEKNESINKYIWDNLYWLQSRNIGEKLLTMKASSLSPDDIVARARINKILTAWSMQKETVGQVVNLLKKWGRSSDLNLKKAFLNSMCASVGSDPMDVSSLTILNLDTNTKKSLLDIFINDNDEEIKLYFFNFIIQKYKDVVTKDSRFQGLIDITRILQNDPNHKIQKMAKDSLLWMKGA